MPLPAEQAQLVADIAAMRYDPLRFVLYAFPWGQAGTELAEHKGPRRWQREVLNEIGKRVRSGASLGEAVQVAVASGHGIGKSALVSWVILWGLSTHADTKIVVTANTEPQLRTKTWPEVSKWHRLAINAHWFRFVATSIFSTDPKHEKTWRADAIPWSEHNTEAFAGLHNQGKRVMLIFDEASAIADKVWEVAEGALTDEATEIVWCAFGNPTRNTGRFRECFGRLAHRWFVRQIDSRTVEGTNKVQLQKWVDDYGEDSDFVRVRVRGLFPSAGSMQLIPSTLIDQAVTAEPINVPGDPLVLGIDIARKGTDQCVARFRRGLDARSIPPVKWRGVDLMRSVGRIAELIRQYKPRAVFIDETGVGAGVVDRLHQLGFEVIGINFASGPDGKVGQEAVANKRAEMWVRLRDWLRAGGVIDNDRELRQDLEGVEYGYDRRNAILLESKDHMAERGLPSPDDGDALALTHAYYVAPMNEPADYGFAGVAPTSGHAVTEYDPMANL